MVFTIEGETRYMALDTQSGSKGITLRIDVFSKYDGKAHNKMNMTIKYCFNFVQSVFDQEHLFCVCFIA